MSSQEMSHNPTEMKETNDKLEQVLAVITDLQAEEQMNELESLEYNEAPKGDPTPISRLHFTGAKEKISVLLSDDKLEQVLAVITDLQAEEQMNVDGTLEELDPTRLDFTGAKEKIREILSPKNIQ